MNKGCSCAKQSYKRACGAGQGKGVHLPKQDRTAQTTLPRPWDGSRRRLRAFNSAPLAPAHVAWPACWTAVHNKGKQLFASSMLTLSPASFAFAKRLYTLARVTHRARSCCDSCHLHVSAARSGMGAKATAASGTRRGYGWMTGWHRQSPQLADAPNRSSHGDHCGHGPEGTHVVFEPLLRTSRHTHLCRRQPQAQSAHV